MDKRRMKKEIFGYLATYLQEYEYSDLASQIRHHVIPENPTEPAQRRYARVQKEVIAHLFTLAYPPIEIEQKRRERRGER